MRMESARVQGKEHLTGRFVAAAGVGSIVSGLAYLVLRPVSAVRTINKIVATVATGSAVGFLAANLIFPKGNKATVSGSTRSQPSSETTATVSQAEESSRERGRLPPCLERSSSSRGLRESASSISSSDFSSTSSDSVAPAEFDWLALPPELWVHVIRQLDYHSVRNLSHTNQQFRAMLAQDWQPSDLASLAKVHQKMSNTWLSSENFDDFLLHAYQESLLSTRLGAEYSFAPLTVFSACNPENLLGRFLRAHRLARLDAFQTTPADDRSMASAKQTLRYFSSPLKGVTPETFQDLQEWRGFLEASGYRLYHVNQMTALAYLLVAGNTRKPSPRLHLLPHMRYLVTELTHRSLFDRIREIDLDDPATDLAGGSAECHSALNRWLEDAGFMLLQPASDVPVRVAQLIEEGFLTSLTRHESIAILQEARRRVQAAKQLIQQLVVLRLSASRPGQIAVQYIRIRDGRVGQYLLCKANLERTMASYDQGTRLVKVDIAALSQQWTPGSEAPPPISCFAEPSQVTALTDEKERHDYLVQEREAYCAVYQQF